MATCNSETILADAAVSGFTKLASRNKVDVLLQLLCNIADGGGSGGGGGTTEWVPAGSMVPDYNGNPPQLLFSTTNTPYEYLAFDDTTTPSQYERAFFQVVFDPGVTAPATMDFTIVAVAPSGDGTWEIGVEALESGNNPETIPSVTGTDTVLFAGVTALRFGTVSGLNPSASNDTNIISCYIEWQNTNITGDTRLLGVFVKKAS